MSVPLFSDLIEVLDPEPHPAALNMAIDEVLLREVTQPLLRIYRWREAAISFGYFGACAEAERIAAGRECVRRWTGGGIVEHGKDLTYTLVVPREHSFLRHSAPESYRLIHEAIARAVAEEGIAAEVLPVAADGASRECFARPVQYDLLAGGVKIAGAAQRRTRWGLLHQGSVQGDLPLTGLGRLMASAFSGVVERQALASKIEADARALAAAKYGTKSWLRRM